MPIVSTRTPVIRVHDYGLRGRVSAIRTLEGIAGKNRSGRPIRRALHRAIGGADFQRRIKGLGVRAVEQVVYGAYSPDTYERTRALIKAVHARTLVSKDRRTGKQDEGSVLYLAYKAATYTKWRKRPRTGTAAKLQPADWTYARFFLPAYSAHSFLRHVPGVPVTRDFLTLWKLTVGHYAKRRFRRAIKNLLRAAKT